MYTGRYPSLAHRLSGQLIAHAQPNLSRQVNFEYLNQQLIWGELQQFLMFLLPLITPGSSSSNPLLTAIIDPVVKLMAGDHFISALPRGALLALQDDLSICATTASMILQAPIPSCQSAASRKTSVAFAAQSVY